MVASMRSSHRLRHSAGRVSRWAHWQSRKRTRISAIPCSWLSSRRAVVLRHPAWRASGPPHLPVLLYRRVPPARRQTTRKGFSTPTPWVATASRASRTRAIPAAFRPRPRDSRGPDHSQFQHIDPNSPQYLAALRLAKSRLGARSQSLSPPPSIQRRATMRVRWALSQRRDRMVLSIARSGSTDLPRKEA
jgi:hypothetical protein